MRPFPDKKFGVWLDHSGNYLRFRKDWDGLFEEGVKELLSGGETAKKEPTEKEKKDSKCQQCGSLWIAGASSCYHCGYERPLRGISTQPGELEELNGVLFKTNDNQIFYSELIHYARMRGYKEGWAAHKYKEKYGAFPRGLKPEPIATSFKTKNWIQSRNIAWAKSKSKAY
jgi:hypothetical protein